MKWNKFFLPNNNYAIIEKDEQIYAASWKIHKIDYLTQLQNLQTETRRKIVFITPFSLANREKWYETHWNEPILAMEVETETFLTREELLWILENIEVSFSKITPSVEDGDFSTQIKWIIWEIEGWNINQMILSRTFSTNIDVSQRFMLWLYKKLLEMRWQYMTYLFDIDDKVFMWATPEKHLCIYQNQVVMNPIAWTMWKGKNLDFFERLMEFLNDQKEIEELWMVIDEELKMMMKLTHNWRIEFPILRETWAVVHTEWEIIWEKKDSLDFMDSFRETLYAPTLVWWPLEWAFKMIKKYETDSRWYYWWAFGILWDDFLDTAIVIRSAFIDKLNNILSVRAWAWIVKRSYPSKEVHETTLKSNWFFWAMEWKSPNIQNYLSNISDNEKEELQKILEERKKWLSSFYFDSQQESLENPEIKWKTFLFINSWDDFVFMSAFMIRKMWWIVEIKNNQDVLIENINDYDVVVLGPWYWDINDEYDGRMANLQYLTQELINSGKKIIWICLWHQAICKVLWYEVKRQQEITQWVQKEVNIYWKKVNLAFYNSFSPVLNNNTDWIDVFFDDRILSLNRKNISSIQAHPESIMSKDGFEVLKEMVLKVLS